MILKTQLNHSLPPSNMLFVGLAASDKWYFSLLWPTGLHQTSFSLESFFLCSNTGYVRKRTHSTSPHTGLYKAFVFFWRASFRWIKQNQRKMWPAFTFTFMQIQCVPKNHILVDTEKRQRNTFSPRFFFFFLNAKKYLHFRMGKKSKSRIDIFIYLG